jgi:tRNA (guanine37-N1)-methyltransferase
MTTSPPALSRRDSDVDGVFAPVAAPGGTISPRGSLQNVRIDVFTILPELVRGPLTHSLLGRAIEAGVVEVAVHDLRDWTTDRHRSVDDEAFGGGPGMVLKPEPIFAAVESLDPDRGRVLVMSPAGRRLDQAFVRELAGERHLTVICGRYEGVDERVVHGLPAEEVSIGDYVLAGGELAALVLIEAVTRLVPGVIGKEESHRSDSFGQPDLLDHPHYTRPREYRGMPVPDVLLSGNHSAIDEWRRAAAETKTRKNRPDLR